MIFWSYRLRNWIRQDFLFNNKPALWRHFQQSLIDAPFQKAAEYRVRNSNPVEAVAPPVVDDFHRRLGDMELHAYPTDTFKKRFPRHGLDESIGPHSVIGMTDEVYPKGEEYAFGSATPGLGARLDAMALRHAKKEGVTHVTSGPSPLEPRRKMLERAELQIAHVTPIDE